MHRNIDVTTLMNIDVFLYNFCVRCHERTHTLPVLEELFLFRRQGLAHLLQIGDLSNLRDRFLHLRGHAVAQQQMD